MASRPGLTKTSIARAAAELGDREGLQNLTLAAVAAHLGVRTPSLYNHIDGMDGLRLELSLLGLDELNRRLQQAALGKSADHAVRNMLLAYRAFARERPSVYEMTLRAPDPTHPELQSAASRIIDTILTVLEPYALSPDDAIHVVRGFRAIGHGFASLEAAGGFGIALSTDESYEHLIRAFLLDLNARNTQSQ